MRRELLQKTDYSFQQLQYLGRTSANPSTNNNLMHMFLATGGEKNAEQKLDDNEDIEVELISLEELKQLIRDNAIVQSMHVTCILYALRKLGQLDSL